MMTKEGVVRWTRVRQKGQTRFALFYGSVLGGTFFTVFISAGLTHILGSFLDYHVPFVTLVLCIAPVSFIGWFFGGRWLWSRIEFEYQDQMKRDAENT